MKIKDLLQTHGHKAYTLEAGASVEAAIEMLAANRIGAVIVLQEDFPVGIFAERDVLRCHLRHRHRDFSDIRVADAMTNKLITGDADDTLKSALTVMLKADIRHLPVREGGKIVGMLTISDMARHVIEHLASEIDSLDEYIADLQNARRD
jgi:IMP dehydrogenase